MSIFFKARERPQFLLLNFALNKLIHIKNYVVGKKKKKKRWVGNKKNFIWTHSATFSSMNMALLGQHKAEDKQELFKSTSQQGKDLIPKSSSQTHV